MLKFLKCEFSSFVQFLFTLFGIYLVVTFFKPDPFISMIAFGAVIVIYAVFFIVQFIRMLTIPNYDDFPCDEINFDNFFTWIWAR